MRLFRTKIEKLESQLKYWGEKLDALGEKAGKAGAEVNAEFGADYQKSIAEFRFKYDEAQKKLADYKAAGAEKWNDFKDDIRLQWKDLEITFKRLTFKK